MKMTKLNAVHLLIAAVMAALVTCAAYGDVQKVPPDGSGLRTDCADTEVLAWEAASTSWICSTAGDAVLGSIALGTDTTGNYVASATADDGLEMTGTEGGSLGVKLPAATDALSATVNSGSGLETLAAGLALIQGCADTQVLAWDETNDYWECATAGGAGDTVGPASATDNAIVRFDGTTGKLLQNSVPTISDTGDITLIKSSAQFEARASTTGDSGSFRASIEGGAGGFTHLLQNASATGGTHFGVSAAGLGLVTSEGISSSGLAIGTKTVDPLIFGINDVERGRFDTDGSFKIKSTGAGTPTIFEVTTNASTGTGNTVAGYTAGDGITSGSNNTLFGYEAGTTITAGNGNTVFGYQAFKGVGGGGTNSCFGIQACGTANTIGNGNIGIGELTLLALDTDGTGSDYNIGIGTGAGSVTTAGNYTHNIWLGYDAGGAQTTVTDSCLGVGRSTQCTASNAAFFGSATAPYTSTTVTRSTTGSADVQALNTELITLSTAGATTASSGNIVPASSIIDAIACRVTTTITTATDWVVKVTGGNNFNLIGAVAGASTSLTAGNTVTWVPNAHADQYNTSATTITITTTGTPGAGAIRCAVHSRTFTPPTS